MKHFTAALPSHSPLRLRHVLQDSRLALHEAVKMGLLPNFGLSNVSLAGVKVHVVDWSDLCAQVETCSAGLLEFCTEERCIAGSAIFVE